MQDEFEAFKDTAEQVAEAKDAELERLLGVNASLKDEITILSSRQVQSTFPYSPRIGRIHFYMIATLSAIAFSKGIAYTSAY